MGETPEGHDPYAALRVRDFRLYLLGNVIVTLGWQMQSVAVGWEIYRRTGSKMALGMVGFVQFLPIVGLVLLTGYVADRVSRRRIIMSAMILFAAASSGLAWISAAKLDYFWMYVCLFCSGVARAFQQPAKASYVPQIVPRERFSNAITWHTGGFHLASVLGPAAGGLLIGWLGGATLVYILDAASALTFLGCLLLIQARPAPMPAKEMSIRNVAAGAGFVWRHEVILGAMTLDMFAVLLGGATTLLPVYAEDILHVGAAGLGWMRTAPAIGALAMAFVLAHRPPLARAGRALLWSVAGFGVAMIIFGMSRSFWLTVLVLFLSGALDNVSVVIRHTLVQMLTPDELRGRVSAVNSLFIGASNELGGFESGVVAHWFGPTVSVVSGGIGTLMIVGLVALRWPRLRRHGRLNEA